MLINLALSFIIPALNEERNIQLTIRSIRKAVSNQPHEIIVADNGSIDRTAEVARNSGATVIVNRQATIGGLRNSGAEVATGAVLVFIDADVQLDEGWLSVLKQEMMSWPEDNKIVTGSTCLLPFESSFIQRNWFAKLNKTGTNYINSGHLIVSREMFDIIGGFDHQLKTAEDYDFCQRAKKNGAKLVKAKNLKAYHYGYPKTLKGFILREAWHGRQDVSSLKRFLSSKTAIASAVNSMILAGSLGTYLLTHNTSQSLALLILSLALCVILTGIKFGRDTPVNFLKTTACFEIYLISRAFSIFYKKQST